MDNVWLTPEGYQRTSKKLQKRCLKLLLSFGESRGNILDVGCGTGNALLFIPEIDIDTYIGVDLSKEMVTFATEKHSAPNIKFVVNNFLDYSPNKDQFFDTIICAACLHWFIPDEQRVIDNISCALRPGGSFFLSCAFNFEYFSGERDIQEMVLTQIRDKYKTIAPISVFDDFRFDCKKLSTALKDFEVLKTHRIEERVEFDSFQDFRDWHLGSGSIVYQQFDEAIRETATEDYYKMMYEAYTSKKYKISYSTALMLLRKRNV